MANRPLYLPRPCKARRVVRELSGRETVMLSLLVIALSGWLISAAPHIAGGLH